MIDPFKLDKKSIGDLLFAKELRNCGLYFIFDKDELIYIGKASSITLQRRLGEHVSADNAFNSLLKKMSHYIDVPLFEQDKIFDFINKELKFSVVSYNVHYYDNDNMYHFDKELSNEIKVNETILIKKYDPILNGRKTRMLERITEKRAYEN